MMKEQPYFMINNSVDNDSDHCIVVEIDSVDDCFERMMVLMIMMMMLPATVILRAPARCPNC